MSHACSLRFIVLILVAWLGLGCSKAVLLNPKGQPDAGGPGKADAPAQVGDAPSQVVVLLDAPLADRGPVQEDGACSRTVNLRDVTIARPVPFDVVIVADNSDSLSWSRDSLSAGLRNLLARVHGHEARFFVLTTTQYGASSKAAVSPFTGKDLVSWKDSVSGAAYLNEVTTYHQECTDGNGASRTCPTYPVMSSDSWKVMGTWQFQMPPPVAAITAAMDDGEIAGQQKHIADAILALGGGGSQQEQPICTLLRYLGQDSAALPKHAVFVVLSDEDDTSPPEVCLSSFAAEQQVAGAGTKVFCDSNCPEYLYQAEKSTLEEALDFTCVPVDDKGTAHPERATQKSLFLQTVAQCAGDGGSTTATCTAADLTQAGTSCGAGTLVQNCTHKCGVGNGMVFCYLSRPDNKTDLCTQPFDQGGMHYANLLDFCVRSAGSGWGQCQVLGLKPADPDGGTSISYAEHTTPLVSGKSTADLIQTVKSTGDRLIGKSNYSIEAIVLDPAFSCPLHSGQSYATNLRSLASSASDVFPLCEDYAPAIERIATFADYLIQTTFPLDLDEYEAVDSVVVTNQQGGERTVADTSYNYDRTAKLLQFNTGVLTAQDESLAVNVARYCKSVIP